MKKKHKIYIVIVIFIGIILLTLFPFNKNIYINENKLKGNLIVWTTERYYDYFQEIKKDIEEENNDVKIDIVIIDKENYEERIENAKAEDLPNIGVLDFQQIDKSKDKVKMKELNVDIINNYNKNFNETRLQEITEEEEFYGVPFTSNPIVLYIKKEVLQKYGFKEEDIKTWNDLIEIGEKIKDKSEGKYNIFSKEDEKNIKYLLSAELVNDVEKNLNEEDIISKINSIYKKEYIVDSAENSLFRFSSIDFFNTDIYKEDKWVAINPPTFKNGENKFFDIGGENLVILKIDKNEKLIETFITNAAIQKENLFDELEKNNFMPSSLYAIKIKGEEKENKEALSTLINIVDKAPKINNYKLFKEVNKKINY